MSILQKITLILSIIGAINWGSIGFFQFDLVAAIFGGEDAGMARFIFILVGISGLISISILNNSRTNLEAGRSYTTNH
ncbi:DUF378 domain-containing protein [Niallia circulans]|uniref:DUF378 domain-containing protein n=1 Tax=Niallia circulans TaxID=1397 RepID=A0A553SUQ3_NIACI|nr:DUF378 domain-containing protein [Niallia circulans]TRZ40706.1 DUF378 domain-containing protein [Niallia circulans]